MNFNALVNTKGIKGSRRGGNVKETVGKAATATKEVAMKAAFGVAGIMPATNNKVNAVEHASVTRDRELLHEISKNRIAIDEVRIALGLAPVPVSTTEEIVEAVSRMEEAERVAKEAAGPAPTVLDKLKNALKKEEDVPAPAPVPTPETEVEVVEPAPQPITQHSGPSRKLVSSPEASVYDYSNISEQA